MSNETLDVNKVEEIAMYKLKDKWAHLYLFGLPKRPFPTEYERDLNNVIIGLYEGAKWQAERMYSEEEVLELLDLLKRSIAEINHIKYTYKDKGHCVKYLSDCENVIEQFKKK